MSDVAEKHFSISKHDINVLCCICFITARRSLGQGNIFPVVCLSTEGQRLDGVLDRDPPEQQRHHGQRPPDRVLPGQRPLDRDPPVR